MFRRTTILLLTSAALLGCTAEEVQPADLQASFYLTSDEGQVDVDVTAVYLAEDGLESEDLRTSVNSLSLVHERSGSEEPTAHIFRGRLQRPGAGDPFSIALEMPGGSAELTVPMVQPASFVGDPPGDVAPGQALEVAWSAATAGERDWISFRVDDTFWSLSWPPMEDDGMVAATEGATSVTVPAAVLASWLDAITSVQSAQRQPTDQPVVGSLVLFRTRSASTTPTFAQGEIHLGVVLATVPMTLLR